MSTVIYIAGNIHLMQVIYIYSLHVHIYTSLHECRAGNIYLHAAQDNIYVCAYELVYMHPIPRLRRARVALIYVYTYIYTYIYTHIYTYIDMYVHM